MIDKIDKIDEIDQEDKIGKTQFEADIIGTERSLI